jgi:hypothetical protein
MAFIIIEPSGHLILFIKMLSAIIIWALLFTGNIMVFKNPTKGVRAVLFDLLAQPNAVNNYYNAEQIAELCNSAIGYDNDEGIDSFCVAQALSFGEKYYNIPFADAAGVDIEGMFYGAVSHRFKTDKITAAGRFTSEDMEAKARDRLAAGDLTRINIRNWDLGAVSDVAKGLFTHYVDQNAEAIKKRAQKEQSSKK